MLSLIIFPDCWLLYIRSDGAWSLISIKRTPKIYCGQQSTSSTMERETRLPGMKLQAIYQRLFWSNKSARQCPTRLFWPPKLCGLVTNMAPLNDVFEMAKVCLTCCGQGNVLSSTVRLKLLKTTVSIAWSMKYLREAKQRFHFFWRGTSGSDRNCSERKMFSSAIVNCPDAIVHQRLVVLSLMDLMPLSLGALRSHLCYCLSSAQGDFSDKGGMRKGISDNFHPSDSFRGVLKAGIVVSYPEKYAFGLMEIAGSHKRGMWPLESSS